MSSNEINSARQKGLNDAELKNISDNSALLNVLASLKISTER